MAMKVTKTNVHRLTVTMSCGCKVYAEFNDPQCKTPTNPVSQEAPDNALPEQVFTVCMKHREDPGLTMLQFLLGERLEEAVEEAQKTPVHRYSPTDVDPEASAAAANIVATGESVQAMGIKMPKRPTGDRPDPTKPKTLQRSQEQLKAAGAATPKVAGGVETGNALDIDMVAEDSRVTALTDSTLGFLIDKEDGVLDDEEEA